MVLFTPLWSLISFDEFALVVTFFDGVVAFGSIDLEALVRRLVSNLGLITVRSGMVIGFTVFKRPKIHPAVLLFWV